MNDLPDFSLTENSKTKEYKYTQNSINTSNSVETYGIKLDDGRSFQIHFPIADDETKGAILDANGYPQYIISRDNYLGYQDVYGLEHAKTLYRGTIRRVGFSRAWNVFVQLGMTDDSYTIDDSINMSYRDFVNSFLPYSPTDSVELKFRHALKIDQDDMIWDKFLELDIFSSEKMVALDKATPAQILQKILMDSWTLSEDDKDMIVMYHKFGYELNGEKHQIDATMVTLGKDQTYTAMSKTVGLPVAIATLAILNGEIKTPGVQIPITKEVYGPILKAMESHDVIFKEYEMPYLGYNPLNV